jgi:carbamoylphosphate synthase large subunit
MLESGRPVYNMKKAPALVTNGWVRTAYNIIESLGRRGIPVHVVDRSRSAMCRHSRWAMSFHRVPSFYEAPEDYAKAVADIARKVGANVLIPTLEDNIALADHVSLLPAELSCVLPAVETLRLANDKWEVTRLCGRLGVPYAESFVPESFDELQGRSGEMGFPAVIKTRLGNAGKGVAIVEDAGGLARRYREFIREFSIPQERWPMVQEYLGSDVFGVCMIYNHGKLIASSAEEYLRCKEENRFSTSVYRRSVNDPSGVASCRKVADALSWHGVIHFDLIRDPRTGVGKITEINPRFWGGLSVAIAAGVDFPYLLYELALTGKITNPPQTYRDGVYSRWVLGELIGILNLAKRKVPVSEKFSELREIMRSPFKGTTDDLRLSDPLPFLMEMYDYFRRYRETRSSNPAEEGMVG